MVRMYYKLRYNEDLEVYEVYDPHSNKAIASGEQIGYLKVKSDEGTHYNYHPLEESDLIELIDKGVIVWGEYDKKTDSFEQISNKVVLGWSGNEYLKSLIVGRFKL